MTLAIVVSPVASGPSAARNFRARDLRGVLCLNGTIERMRAPMESTDVTRSKAYSPTSTGCDTEPTMRSHTETLARMI